MLYWFGHRDWWNVECVWLTGWTQPWWLRSDVLRIVLNIDLESAWLTGWTPLFISEVMYYDIVLNMDIECAWLTDWTQSFVSEVVYYDIVLHINVEPVWFTGWAQPWCLGSDILCSPKYRCYVCLTEYLNIYVITWCNSWQTPSTEWNWIDEIQFLCTMHWLHCLVCLELRL